MTTSTARPGRLRTFARRGFLGTLGAGGLTAASAVFGKSAPAYALCQVNCCRLAVCPNISYTTCARSATYIWGCAQSSFIYCTCCEAPQAGFQFSAARCTYG